MTVSFAIIGLVGVIHIVAWIAVCVRRLHDMGLSGWLVLLCIVVSLLPILGYLLVSAVLAAAPGTKGANRYGENPHCPVEILDLFGPDGAMMATAR